MQKYASSAAAKEISLTIYNDNFGAVQELRQLDLTGAETELVYADVAQQIETDSLLVEGIRVLEFNYDYDLVGRAKLLLKYIDKEVYLKDKESGQRISCRLLAVDGSGQCVLEDIKSKEIYVDAQGEIILPSLPEGLLVKPALVWKIEPAKADDVRVSYLSKGLGWQADYVVELQDDKLNIAGWAKIENNCGTSFTDARIKLMAGDVKRSPDLLRAQSLGFGSTVAAAAPAAQAEEKTFFDYHMYTLKNKTTLKNNQSKQINILNGFDVPYKKYYRISPAQTKVQVMIEFSNTKEAGLGIPLPKGKIKLYKSEQADQSLEFIGEDRIEHTTSKENIRLLVGHAFDVVYDKKQTSKRQEGNQAYYQYSCLIKNRKDEEIEVEMEHLVGGFWEMKAASHPYEKTRANLIKFKTRVAAQDRLQIEFEYMVMS